MKEDNIVCGPGKTVIISGFPGVGKSYFANLVKNDNRFLVLDLSSTDYRVGLKDEYQKEWEKHYINDLVVPMYHNYCKVLSACNPENSPAVFLFVSSHEGVRQALNNAGVDFYYVLPASEAIDVITNRVKARWLRSSTDHAEENRRAFDFISQHGKSMVLSEELGTANDFEHQTRIWLKCDENHNAGTLESVIMNDIYSMPAPKADAKMVKFVEQAITDVFLDTSSLLSVIKPKHVKKVTKRLISEYTVGCTSEGKMIIVSKTPVSLRDMFIGTGKYYDKLFDRIGYYGMNEILIGKEDARTLVDACRKVNLDTEPSILPILRDIEMALNGYVLTDDDVEDIAEEPHISHGNEATDGKHQKPELSTQQIEQIDAVENGVFELIKIMTGRPNLAWNIAFIGVVADAITETLCRLGFRVHYPAIVDNDHIEEYQEPDNPREWEDYDGDDVVTPSGVNPI